MSEYEENCTCDILRKKHIYISLYSFCTSVKYYIISLAEMVFLTSTLCARIAKHTNEFFGLAQVTSGSQELSLSWTKILSNLPEMALIVY